MRAPDKRDEAQVRPFGMTDMRHEIIMQQRDILHETLSCAER